MFRKSIFAVLLVVVANLVPCQRANSQDFSNDSHFQKAYELVCMTYDTEGTKERLKNGFLQVLQARYGNDPRTKEYASWILWAASDALNKSLEDNWDEEYMKLAYSKIYKHKFSENELGKIIEFYNTDVGKKYIRLYPDVIREGINAEKAIKIPEKLSNLIGENIKMLKSEGKIPENL